MRSAALSIAVLLGIASLAVTAEAQATPSVSATITIKDTVQVAGKRGGYHRYHHGAAPHRHKGWYGHHSRHHWPAYTKRLHRAPVVIVKPTYQVRRGFPYRYWPSRLPIRQGFTRHHHW